MTTNGERPSVVPIAAASSGGRSTTAFPFVVRLREGFVGTLFGGRLTQEVAYPGRHPLIVRLSEQVIP